MISAGIQSWVRLATSSAVVRRAVKMAIVVGCLLAMINHGDALLRGEVTGDRLAKIATTFCVPYLVSTISSVGALRELERHRPQPATRED